MRYFTYFLKTLFYNVYILILNALYYFRFYYKVKIGYFNSDFSNTQIKEDWELTFIDEFEGDTVDFKTKWNPYFSNGDAVSNPAETPSLSSLDCINIIDNKVHLTIKKNEGFPENSEFPLVRGNLSTKPSYKLGGKNYFSQQFGYFETSCKVPKNGMLFWPAFWLYGENWPPEIDIFEFMDSDDIGTEHTKSISMTTHWGPDGKRLMKNKQQSQLGRNLKKLFRISLNFDEHFHVYGCRWEWDYIEWYIDNIPVFRTTYNIPDCRMHIIIGNAGWMKQLPTEEQMNDSLIIDYIRAYKRIK